ncbi:Tetratricopeptide repeat-containing protein [Amphibacillus marinus]|uniref:Tetratricopeptide repeat-containing protein n=1 Tax=Amphibacillus marinus TaxID=872970 RepID=A0A1H8GGK2_9BACI|nr:tetratricopeptide repeat protein [Amphibacillus marinus]SEN43132.1 Tetratricopeptide repeat-containing protein [Amphibacillus marinus]
MEDIYQAIQLIEQNKEEEALRIIHQFLPDANDDEQFVIADLYIQLGLISDAKMILEDLLNRYPNESDLQLTLAEILIDLEEDAKAIHLLEQIHPDSDHYLSALLTTADLYQSQGLFEVAEQKLIEAKQLAPQERLIDFARAELAFSIGEYQKAVVHYEKVYHEHKQIAEVDIALRLAESLATIGEFEAALNHYQAAKIEDEETLFRFGFIAFRANRVDIAIKTWEEVVKRDSEYPSVYLYLAEAYEEEGLIEQAFETATNGLKLDPINKELLLAAAGLARRNGQAEQSYQYAREAVAIDTGYKEAVLFLIENYRQDDDFQAIIDLLTHIIEQGEADGYYKWELAKAYEAEEAYPQALQAYDEAYEDFGDDSDFLKAYGYFLVEEGKKEQASAIFARYLTIEPSDSEIESYVERLNS